MNEKDIEKNKISDILLNGTLEKKPEKKYFPCDKCEISDKNEATFSFSCLHNICTKCLFNFFIQNKFRGLKLDFLLINCPICQYGIAKFNLDTLESFLNHENCIFRNPHICT